jgi:hypothetical protein
VRIPSETTTLQRSYIAQRRLHTYGKQRGCSHLTAGAARSTSSRLFLQRGCFSGVAEMWLLSEESLRAGDAAHGCRTSPSGAASAALYAANNRAAHRGTPTVAD